MFPHRHKHRTKEWDKPTPACVARTLHARRNHLDRHPEERDHEFRRALEDLFERAVALPREKRDAFVELKCADAPELAERLRRLLAAYAESG